jgi:hypothetical protein
MKFKRIIKRVKSCKPLKKHKYRYSYTYLSDNFGTCNVLVCINCKKIKIDNNDELN